MVLAGLVWGSHVYRADTPEGKEKTGCMRDAAGSGRPSVWGGKLEKGNPWTRWHWITIIGLREGVGAACRVLAG